MLKKLYQTIENSYITYALYCMAFFSFALSFSFCRDVDLLWHIKLGEEIFANKCVSLYDSFSWQRGLIWYQQEWLFDCFIYLVSLLPDLCFELLFVINSTLMILLGMWYSKPSSKMCYTLFGILVFAFVPANHGNRPSEFSVWIVLGILFVLMGSLSVLKKCLLLFLFGVLIANFHAACILPLFGFGVILFISEIILCMRGMGEKKRLIEIPLSYVAFVIGSFVGPCGIKLYSHLMVNTGTRTTQYISEWLPWKPGVVGFLIVVVSLAALFFSFPVIWKDAKQFRFLFVWLGGLGLTFMHGGKGGIFLILFSLFFLYPYLELLVNYCIPDIACLRTYGFILFFFISIGYAFIFGGREYTPFYVQSDNYIPGPVITELKRGYEEKGEDFRVFNAYLAGNFLIWHDIPCFIDSRQVPYVSESEGGGSVDDYFELLYTSSFSPSVYDRFFDKYDFTYVLETTELNISEYLAYRGDYERLMSFDSSDISLWRKKQ